ncbi:uncharacterized protein LOC143018760 [Oratosquilla oratoria]|uniref:uncharacterized protein LOC143018760 n=1 Tax=Oratosquilla oratoria TaxID=337810 RepID=UPI003F76CC8D
MADSTAECTTSHFFHGWVANLGAPHTIITDQGPQWESQAWTDLLLFLGTSRERTMAYHPQSNGMNIRSTVKKDLQHTPAELVYGEDLRLPSQYTPALETHSELSFMPTLRQAMLVFTPKLLPWFPAASLAYQHPTLKSADKVFLCVDVRNCSLAPKYTCPHQDIEDSGAFTATRHHNQKEFHTTPVGSDFNPEGTVL